MIPFDHWTRISEKAMRFALTISPEVIAVHIDTSENPNGLVDAWPQLVEEPARRAAIPAPKLEVIQSLYRYVIGPLLEFILAGERRNPGRPIAVVLPNLVESHRYHRFLHNQRAELLTAPLLFRADQRIVIINVPWYFAEK